MRPLNLSLCRPSLKDIGLPCFVYSFSSQGFEELSSRISGALPSLPAYLISLYDYSHHLSGFIFPRGEARFRIWDSGGYENGTLTDSSDVYGRHPRGLPWNEQAYLAAATRIPWGSRDVLVNFDDPTRTGDVNRQVEYALWLFDQIPGKYIRDVIIHVDEHNDPAQVADAIRPYRDKIDVVGVVEDEASLTWAHGARFIARLRSALDVASPDRYLPIHVFGCLHPRGLIRLTLAGADIFDGLTWMRYFMSGDRAHYRRELEYDLDAETLMKASPGSLAVELMRRNVTELEDLRAKLSYALGSEDFTEFEDDKRAVDDAIGGAETSPPKGT